MSPRRTLLRALTRSLSRQTCLQRSVLAYKASSMSLLPRLSNFLPSNLPIRGHARYYASRPPPPAETIYERSKPSPSPPPPPPPGPPRKRPPRQHLNRLLTLLALLTLLFTFYQTQPPFRHVVIASIRCARLMKAVILDVWDYKSVFAAEEHLTSSEEDRAIKRKRRKECHLRSAQRMLEALKINSGVYVKIGQHVAAVHLLPQEWTSTMRPLQDQCFPTPLEEIDEMLYEDLRTHLSDLFTDIDPHPIGVASLAQVHRATDRETGRRVAVKVQHPDLQEFAQVDMKTVNFAIAFVKRVFPDFEFSWLGEEMNEMLPLELDFKHEASNSRRARGNFSHLEGKTSVYFPEILWAERRCMVMEYIDGARVDDLNYLKNHHIDRNQVSQELSRIFSQMVYLDGYFHADPHHGNLLIRTKAKGSKSPYNFDICLLDHGQYFDIPDDLRVNYARFWLSLIKRTSKGTTEERKKYAKLVGNIDDEMYPILESAITGRINMSDPSNPDDDLIASRPSSLLDSRHMDDKDMGKLRAAVMERDGLIVSIFELLRTVPRRLLMILKLSDLQRSLDHSLATTHGETRIFLIVAQYCAEAVWRQDLASVRDSWRSTGLSIHLLTDLVSSFLSHAYWKTTLGVVEWGMDVRAKAVKVGLWVHGLSTGGLAKAQEEAAGLN